MAKKNIKKRTVTRKKLTGGPKANNARVVNDQLGVQHTISQIHENRRQLDERAFYPAHDKRTESKEYKKVHDKLTKKLDLPCLVCGVKNSTLKNKKENKYKAKQMETHHHVIEWALANAIDEKKFNKALRPNLAHRHPTNPVYRKNMSAEDIKNWVDHSEDNLWVLCDVHHRHKYLGIHAISFPIWSPQDLLSPKFEAYVDKQIMGDGNDN